MSKVIPPRAIKRDKQLKKHGDIRLDPYYWLNSRGDDAVLVHLQAENSYTESVLKPVKHVQEKVYKEIVKRIPQTDMSVPYKKHGYYYYTRYETGKEHPIYARKLDVTHAKEQILLDVNKLAEESEYCHVAALEISHDKRLMVYALDTVGRRIYDLYVINIETREIIQILNGTSADVVWADDNNTLFYGVKDKTLRVASIFRHTLGQNQAEDQRVYHEEDTTFHVSLYRSKTEQLIMLLCHSTLTTEYHYLSVDEPQGVFQVFTPRRVGHEYHPVHAGDGFYVLSNNNAKNNKIMWTKNGKTHENNWQIYIEHKNDCLLEEVEVFTSYVVVKQRMHGLTELLVIHNSSQEKHKLKFPDPTYALEFSINEEMNTDLLRIYYSSLTTPDIIYDYNMVSRKKKLLKQKQVVGGHKSAEYESVYVHASASDGRLVPISLVYKKSLVVSGQPAPLLLYGYGSYGHSLSASFSSVKLSLLDRGMIFAIAHIRGGEELGRDWYDGGRTINKMNTFTDFIVCAEHLIALGYTQADKLSIMGGSAGGLLIGAVINMRPDLFKAAVAAVPFVDVVTTMLDDSIPLTTGEYDEWGNPNNKADYMRMLSYSPYDNIEKQVYPAILATTGYHDSQVQYWEPAKWVAKLRDYNEGDGDICLFTEMSAGHGGKTGRFQQYKETALIYTFILMQLGLSES